eukprot:748246-Hanusia_phi.AAC.1
MSFTDYSRANSLRYDVMSNGRSGFFLGSNFSVEKCCSCCNPAKCLTNCCLNCVNIPKNSIAMVVSLRQEVYGKSSRPVEILPPEQLSNSMLE